MRISSTAVEYGGPHGAVPVEKRVFNGPASQADGGFDRVAAFVDHGIDGIQACFDHRLNCVQASLNDILRSFCGRGGSRLSQYPPSSPSYSPPPPSTGSIIIFMEPACGCDAISIASTACSI